LDLQPGFFYGAAAMEFGVRANTADVAAKQESVARTFFGCPWLT